MHELVKKEYERISALIGENVTEEVIAKATRAALADLIRQGVSKEALANMLRSAKPLGDFAWFEKRLPYQEFQDFFGSHPIRNFGIDGSRSKLAYGSSTTPEILNLSPWNSCVDTYDSKRGIKKEVYDPEKEKIFKSGHLMEPVYREYFKDMFSSRYEVIVCDIQWESRKYEHFIGNVDGLLYDKETGEYGILEIKHSTANNIKTQKAVQSGDVPKYWDVQVRGYMELLDLNFGCLFLGWGNRPGLETNAMARIERDKDLASSMLEQCEDFMVNNVEAGVRPSFRNIKSTERVKLAMDEIYGPVEKGKAPVSFDKKFKKNFEALKAAQEKIDKAKEKKKAAEAEVEAAQAAYDALTLPLIEELKTAPKGNFVDSDGTHYEVSYDVKNALDVEKVKADFPEVYDDCNKSSVDTQKLKRKYPQVYTECFGPKVNSKRSFSMHVWKEKSR